MEPPKKESTISIAVEDDQPISEVTSKADADSKITNSGSDDDMIQVPLEEERLGGKSPLVTFLTLCVGPLFAQVTQASYGLLNTFWVSRSSHEVGTVAISVAYPIGFFITAFAQFFNVAMSDRVSYLFGKKQKKECAQVVVDILRFCLVAGAILPCIICPCLKPLMRWFGGNEENQKDLLYYMLPQYCGCFVLFMYFAISGLLQAMGNSFIFAACQIASALMNGLVFGPLFVLTFNWNVWGASFANVVSNLVPCLALFICLFTKKFIVKPEIKMFCRPFSRNSLLAMKVAIGQLLTQLANSIPILLFTKWIEQSGAEIGLHGPILESWNVVGRSWGLTICICSGLNQGFLPAASFAYGSNRLRRLLILAYITVGIGTGLTLLISILIECLPEKFAGLWDNDPEYLYYTHGMLKLTFSTVYLNQIILTTTICLQAVKKAAVSITVAIMTMLLPIPVFGAIFFFTKKDDPVRLLYAFIAHDLFSLVVVIIVFVWKLRFLMDEVATDVMKKKEKSAINKIKNLKQEMLPEEA